MLSTRFSRQRLAQVAWLTVRHGALCLALVLPSFVSTCQGSTRYHPGNSMLAVAAMAPGMIYSPVVMLEEDWELNIKESDSAVAAPQVVTVMTPFGDNPDVYFVFEINHRTTPNYLPGGMEVEVWRNDGQVGSHRQ